MAGQRGRQTAIVVVAKAPIPGVAKTRLGRDIGFDEAAQLYEAFLLDSLRSLEDGLARSGSTIAEVARWVSCPDGRHASALTHIVGSEWSVICQRRPGLMGALADAIDDGFHAGADVVVILDADSPGLPYSHVEDCIRLTDECQIVLGPTRDGGYYLIAVRRDAREQSIDLLLGGSYDSSTICDETIRRAEQIGLTAARGPIGFDVDTVEDLRWLIRELPLLSASELERTRLALASITIAGEAQPRR